jgi:zinc/manganese transport system substrate-binding protein
MNRRLFLHTIACVALPVIGSRAAWAVGKVNVVASFSIVADMARQVGGNRVEVASLVGPNSDAHVYEATPGDVRTLADAAIFFVNGLGLEGWMGRLEKSSGFKGKVVTVSKGVKPRQLEMDAGGKGRKITDPHAWQSLANGRIYVQNIRDGLIAVDPGGEVTYQANAGKFMTEIDEVEAQVVSAIDALPPDHRRMITTHDAFGYFGATYGLSFIAPQGVSTESEASVQDVAKIIRQIKAQKIPAVFLENISDRRLLDQIAKETGAKIGGALYSDALSHPSGPAGTYLDMFRYNIQTLVAALS